METVQLNEKSNMQILHIADSAFGKEIQKLQSTFGY
jgi:hypothetical protein